MENNQRSKHGRVGIIKTVHTPLGFFVLVVLVVETIFGALAGTSEGAAATMTVVGMLLIMLSLIAVVAYLGYKRPEALRGVRPRTDAVVAQDELRSFCQRVAGRWWSFRADVDSLGFVGIAPDETTGTVIVSGRSYDPDGNLVTVWDTTASCINLKGNKLYYYWTGWYPRRPAEPYEGFGEMSFHDSAGRSDTGFGIFSDMNLTDVKSTTRKSSDYRRCTTQEIDVMQEGDSDRIGALVREKLKIKRDNL